MAKPAPTYDLMLLLDASADEDRRAKILSDVEGLIGRGGTLTARHDYGRRGLTYEIRKKADADYHLLQFQAPTDVLATVDRTLRITDGVQRFRIIKLREGLGAVPDLTASAAPVEGSAPSEEPAPSAA